HTCSKTRFALKWAGDQRDTSVRWCGIQPPGERLVQTERVSALEEDIDAYANGGLFRKRRNRCYDASSGTTITSSFSVPRRMASGSPPPTGQALRIRCTSSTDVPLRPDSA